MRDAELLANLRRALVGTRRAQSECVVESMIANMFKAGTLLYGTVRRVAANLRS